MAHRNDEPPVSGSCNQYGVKSVHPPAGTKHRSVRDPIAAALADNHGCRSFTWKRKRDGKNHIASLSEKTTEIWRALVSLEALGLGKVLVLPSWPGAIPGSRRHNVHSVKQIRSDLLPQFTRFKSSIDSLSIQIIS
jgi:hypothetical protein